MRGSGHRSIEGWRERALVDLEQAGDILSTSSRSVRRLHADGKLQLVKVRGAARVVVESIVEYLERLKGKVEKCEA